MNTEPESEEALDGEDKDDTVVPEVPYEVASYGSDPEVEVLVGRMRKDVILIPPFQRDYVWRQPEASKFIESLLLGLPVPGIFLATEPKTNKQLVIDGQQRLKTLRFFFDGYFNPKPKQPQRRVFALTKVQKRFEGRTYETLGEADRTRLETAIIHATVVKQTEPAGEDTSLFHIFERLNSGGRKLTDQEMRVALYHGSFIENVKRLNKSDNWRNVFGKVHPRLKDQELIIRFLAMQYSRGLYERPMGEFLNKFTARNRNTNDGQLEEHSAIFQKTIKLFVDAVDKPFRLTKTLNVAVFDSCMVGLATRLKAPKLSPPDIKRIGAAYSSLLEDEEYVESVSRSTADSAFVERRIKKAIESFSGC